MYEREEDSQRQDARESEHDRPAEVSRRSFLQAGALAGSGAALGVWSTAGAQETDSPASPEHSGGREVAFASIAELQSRMSSGDLSSRGLVEIYLRRIRAIDDGLDLRSVLALNPDARRIASELDHERRRSGPRGPLHGIPILLKDNIDTHDSMQTTAGSLALAGMPALQDATVAHRLRRRRRRDSGQSKPERMGQFPRLRQFERLERRQRSVPQSAHSRSQSVRFELRLGGGRRRRTRRGISGHRDGRLGSVSLGSKRRLGHQADCGSHKSCRRGADFVHSGHRGRAWQKHRGCRDRARRIDRCGFARSQNCCKRRQVLPGLSPVRQSGRTRRRANRRCT